jgi:probable rRNA maturation factor
MVEVEIVGLRRAGADPGAGADPAAGVASAAGAELPSLREVRGLARAAAHCADISTGHMAVEFVDEQRIAKLNREHRGMNTATDVLSFPVDGAEQIDERLPRELGDVVICAERCRDVREAIVHGVLHLVGFDHETDAGEMLAAQRAVLRAPAE